MICPKCGCENEDRALLCKSCGGKLKLPGALYCKHCGCKHNADAAFCPQCGKPTSTRVPADEALKPDPDEERRNADDELKLFDRPLKRNRGLILGLSVAGALLLIAIVVLAVLILTDRIELGAAPTPTQQVAQTPKLEDDVTPTPTHTSTHTPAASNGASPTLEPSPTASPVGTPEALLPNGDPDPEPLIRMLDSRAMDYAELSAFSREQIGYIRNGVFALSGKVFETQKYIDYFSSKGWYTPYSSDDDVIAARFNELQTRNLETIIQYERDMGWRS